MPIIRRRSDPPVEKPAEKLVEPEEKKQLRRFVFRNKPEVDDLVTRVMYGGMRVPMTAAEWEMWQKYVQVL